MTEQRPNRLPWQLSERERAMRDVLLEWAEVHAPDATVYAVSEVVVKLSRELRAGERTRDHTAWRLKDGATPNAARRLAARMDETWPGAQR
jgi:hypothetical protein